MSPEEREARDQAEHYEHIRQQLADWTPPTEADLDRLRVLLPAQRLAS